MNHRILIFAAALAVLSILIAAGASFSQEDVETVADSAFTDTVRSAVPFAHDDHNEKAGLDECGVCHHVYDEKGRLAEDETSEDRECSECHAGNEGGKSLALIKRYHQRCRSCHLEEKKGPVTCGECHPKP